MTDYKVKEINQAFEGRLLIDWASHHMPVLESIKGEFRKEKPLKEITVGACLHVTKETAILVETLMEGGAEVALCGSNPLSTQDEVAAALAKEGVHVYAWRGQTKDEYYWCVNKVIDYAPLITLDDGADLVNILHSDRSEYLEGVKGGTEETTTGVIRLRAMAKDQALRYPIIAVNDAYTKHLFDNRYGTGQSTIDGILRATNILLAGKKIVVCGYGWCGRGVAQKAKGMGANVIVIEVNPLRALEAVMDGFHVTSIEKASEIGDIFVTTTGNISVIRKEHLDKMKDGAILANSGHFNVEINLSDLETISKSKRTIRSNLQEYSLENGNRLYLLAEGRLVNLAAAEGHPSEVMDMSFANQALCVKYLSTQEKLEIKVHRVPEEIDQRVAYLKLKALNIETGQLTEEQREYLASWKAGTL
jgi:adenosylhomocysteinase